MIQKEDIFEALRQKTGCTFISDLPKASSSTLSVSVRALDAASYTSQEWQDLTAYLTGTPEVPDDSEQAKNCLLDLLGD